MISNFLYLSFCTLYSSSLWRTDTVVFAKWNKLPLLNKPLPRLYWNPLKPFEINKPPGGILEDLRYSSWQRSLHKQGYSPISIGRDVWRRNNGQRSFPETKLTNAKPVENRLKPVFLNLFVQNSGRIWTVVGRGYFSHATSYRENVASARRVSGVWPLPPKLQMN